MDFGAGFRKLALGATAVTIFFACGSASAQQTTGTPGSPDATTTVDSRYLRDTSTSGLPVTWTR